MEQRIGPCPLDVTPMRALADAITTGVPDPLLPENVTHQNSLQVLYSPRFVFSTTDDSTWSRR
jgi:hypothetical protein